MRLPNEFYVLSARPPSLFPFSRPVLGSCPLLLYVVFVRIEKHVGVRGGEKPCIGAERSPAPPRARLPRSGASAAAFASKEDTPSDTCLFFTISTALLGRFHPKGPRGSGVSEVSLFTVAFKRHRVPPASPGSVLVTLRCAKTLSRDRLVFSDDQILSGWLHCPDENRFCPIRAN